MRISIQTKDKIWFHIIEVNYILYVVVDSVGTVVDAFATIDVVAIDDVVAACVAAFANFYLHFVIIQTFCAIAYHHMLLWLQTGHMFG